jgi:MOSC domain-containing protein YiiM/GNAT superfamily N-acetyltransferase
MADGRVLHVNVSDGGVPKLPVASARVTTTGVQGDRQRERTLHGGPHRAVSILGIEAIRRVAAEGHPIAPGTTGENLTVEGFDISALPVGTRLAIGHEVLLELSSPTDPCRTIRDSFIGGRFGRLGVASHPRDSRMYARVLREGVVRAGDPIALSAPADDGAERHLLAARLDRAERASSLAIWRAARSGGHDVRIVDDGELVMAAAPELPGPAFNHALGIATLPHLVGRARMHYTRAGTTGWVWADAPPWHGAVADASAIYAAAPADAVAAEAVAGVVIRRLARDERGTWPSLVAAGADLPGPVARAYVDLEPHLARVAHHHRFVAELDGRPVATGSLHTHRGVGWLRAGTVLPDARGRGIQRQLIAARASLALELGCDIVGASANEGGASARNLERIGARTVVVRARYRVEAAASA